MKYIIDLCLPVFFLILHKITGSNPEMPVNRPPNHLKEFNKICLVDIDPVSQVLFKYLYYILVLHITIEYTILEQY